MLSGHSRVDRGGSMIKLGRTLIGCIEMIEQQPHITGAYISQVLDIDINNIRGYLSRLTRNGLLVKHRPPGSLAPTFTHVEGWRQKVQFRHDIGDPKKSIPRTQVKMPTRITPLPHVCTTVCLKIASSRLVPSCLPLFLK